MPLENRSDDWLWSPLAPPVGALETYLCDPPSYGSYRKPLQDFRRSMLYRPQFSRNGVLYEWCCGEIVPDLASFEFTQVLACSFIQVD